MTCQIISENTWDVVAEVATEVECDEWFDQNDPSYLYHWHVELD